MGKDIVKWGSSSMCRYGLVCVVVCLLTTSMRAQRVLGTRGLMNIPTAEMHPAGTFDGGASLVQKQLTADDYDYYTGIYYIDFTPFSFMEITLRETLLKTWKGDKHGFYQQDRSSTLRVQPLRHREGKWLPDVVLGVNDIYSERGGSYYTAVYGVLTEHIPLKGIGRLAVTAGYAKPFDIGDSYDGVFGGFSFSPELMPRLQFMAEYDTRAFNAGATVLLWNHLNVTCFTREFKGVNGTLGYQYTIKY